MVMQVLEYICAIVKTQLPFTDRLGVLHAQSSLGALENHWRSIVYSCVTKVCQSSL
jgi:hypothetical protein